MFWFLGKTLSFMISVSCTVSFSIFFYTLVNYMSTFSYLVNYQSTTSLTIVNLGVNICSLEECFVIDMKIGLEVNVACVSFM